jgi:16S rRNA (uracil1498-N3)-methyltransferase
MAFSLDERAAGHLRVLRLDEGEVVTLFDGQGGEFTATITNIAKREVQVNLLEHLAIERESPLAITLVQALATGDKMDWIIQKACELGASAIQPVQTARATTRLNADRADKRALHWQGVATAACEQCGRNQVPLIHPVLDFPVWLARPHPGRRLILHPAADQDLIGNRHLADAATAANGVALLVGPEGGFAPEELAAALRAGVEAVQFGPRILRTETAGMAALAALQMAFGDLRAPAC